MSNAQIEAASGDVLVTKQYLPVRVNATSFTDVPCATNTISELLTLSIPANAWLEDEILTFEAKYTLANSISTDFIGLTVDGTFQGAQNIGGSTVTSMFMRGFAKRVGNNIQWAANVVFDGGTNPFGFEVTVTSPPFSTGFDLSIAGGGTTGITAGDVVLNNGLIKLN